MATVSKGTAASRQQDTTVADSFLPEREIPTKRVVVIGMRMLYSFFFSTDRLILVKLSGKVMVGCKVANPVTVYLLFSSDCSTDNKH